MSQHSPKGQLTLYRIGEHQADCISARTKRSQRSNLRLNRSASLSLIVSWSQADLCVAALRSPFAKEQTNHQDIGPVWSHRSRSQYLPNRIHQSEFLDNSAAPTASSSDQKLMCCFQVELILTKPSPSSWPLLELPPAGTELPPGYALTFGVSGRTGTVGGKEIVLSPEDQAKRR